MPPFDTNPQNPMAPVMGSTGAMNAPTPNPGDMAQGLTIIGNAVQMLQTALPLFPIGDEMQKAVIDSIQKLSKIAPASAQVPGVQATNLQGLAQDAQRNQLMVALQRAMGAGEGQTQPQPQQPPMAGPPGVMM